MSSEDRRRVRLLFKNYKRMNHNFKRTLKEFGLIVTESGGNHWRLENPDNWKITFIPQTPSDWRSGKNTAHYVCEILQ